ncbi:hypothetical protein [Nostoc commune]|nr:hypothetical protein [Nostoc commune]
MPNAQCPMPHYRDRKHDYTSTLMTLQEYLMIIQEYLMIIQE